MTKAEVRRLPRIKQRGAAAAPQLLKMYLQHPEIHFPGLPPPAEVIQAENDLHYLELLLHGARGLASHLQDAARARRAFIWRPQMDVYAVLKRLRAPAQVPPGVQSAVQHLQKAMKLGPRVQTHTVTRLKKPLPRSKKAIKELARKAHQAEAGPPSKR